MDVDAVAVQYAAFAEGSGGERGMAFDGEVSRHWMSEAVWRCAKDGRRDSYL